MGAVDFSLDPALVEALQSVLHCEIFVETGTFEGDTIERVRGEFSEIHSLEVSESLRERAAVRFDDDPSVHLHLGDSRDVLLSLKEILKGKRVMYWLDAHWCVGDDVGTGGVECPLLGELDAIG